MDWAKNVPCKNITIYGFCRYENKGCAFNHNTNAKNTNNSANSEPPSSAEVSSDTPSISGTKETKEKESAKSTDSPTSSHKFNVDSQAFKPQSKFTKINSSLREIPSFIPQSLTEDTSSVIPSGISNTISSAMPSALTNNATPVANSGIPGGMQDYNMSLDSSYQPLMSNTYFSQSSSELMSQPEIIPPQTQVYQQPIAQPQHDMFFTTPNVKYQLQYHLYAPPPPPHLQFLEPNERNVYNMFIPSDLREQFLQKNEATIQTLPHSNLPDHVFVYHSLVPLDKTLDKSTRNFGVKNSLYKVFSNNDGNVYTLRRLENYQLTNEKSLVRVNKWKSINNSNIVRFHEAFTSLSFGDNSLFFVYDYYPMSKTLKELHSNKMKLLKETTLWSYIVQITNAILDVHSHGLSVRLLTLDKVIVTSEGKIKLSSCGVSDIINFEKDGERCEALGVTNNFAFVKVLQKEDLVKFGRLILELCGVDGSVSGSSLLNKIAALNYSPQLKKSLKYLVNVSENGEDDEDHSIGEFASKISNQTFKVLNNISLGSDYFESQLSNEIENDRLVRLLAKFNYVLDRPEFNNDPAWSESGERYPIKLLHDYIFHQVDQNGKPVLDLAHTLKALNKLDAGIDEKVLLVSKDESNCIVASYKELKECLEISFRELRG